MNEIKITETWQTLSFYNQYSLRDVGKSKNDANLYIL